MILQAENLSKQYSNNGFSVLAVNDVSFDVSKGDFVTITGPSGSGKTTLLLLLGGLLKPSSGNIMFNGNKLNTNNDNELANFRSNNIGFVMQNFALIPYLNAFENLMLALALQTKDKKKQKEHSDYLLGLVGLKDRMNHFPRQLSAGQQQRVAIARALANKPQIILADEPTGNLDPNLSVEILSLLNDINKKENITILMVTHSPEAAKFGNYRIHLNEGKIIKND
jgi:putative ABC transport system ATP-binding protein